MLTAARQLRRETLKKTRIAGNLFRANDGKFTSGGASESAPAADAPAPEAEQPKQRPRRQQNAAARRERASREAEARAAEAEAEQAVRDEEDARLDAAEKPAERARLSREIARARRERAAELKKARAERAAAERQSRDEEDAAAAEEGAQAKPRDPKAEKPKKGGGGGGKGKPEEEPAKVAAQAERDAERAARRAEVEKRRAEADARRAEADRRRAENDAKRERQEAEREERAQRQLTDLAQRAGTPGMRLTDSEWERLVVEGLAQRDGATLRLTEAGQAQARRLPPATKAAPAPLAVFKDAAGRDRWMTITTTAYEDRDAEIITTKGIGYAVAYGDATGQRGTLRYWHVPGLDLGPCDYQAQGGPGGRWLIESGTFYGPREAALGRAMAAKGWHMSPGFYHPDSEPYPAEVGGRRLGLYDHPMIFERSPTPPGRASNLFGRFATTKERAMNEEKKAALKALVGGDEALLGELLGRIEQTDKAAQTAGVAFKDAPEWAQALFARLDALEAREKAAPPVVEKAPMPPAEMMEAGATELADGAELEAEGESDNLLSESEIDAIATRVAEKLMGSLDGLATKMAEVDAELKGRGYQRMKEAPDALAELKKAVGEIAATVKQLNGDAPARGYRPTLDNGDIPAALAAALKGEGDGRDPYADVMTFLRPAP